MTISPINKAFQQLRRAVLVPDGGGLTDGQLLARFLEQHDEAAFEALVRRHGPMVLGVCRRVLRHSHDAEDAFQATFLVLVRKATTVLPREKVANWLHGVAYHTAVKARATAARRQVREKPLGELPEPAAPFQDRERDWHPVLDREVSLLPDKYRSPLVLCDLQGKTRSEAARQLGWPEGTVAGRLARARTMLARRLARHGIVLSGVALAAAITQEASACVPVALVATTLRAASAAAAPAAAASVISASFGGWIEGVLKAMLLHKLKTASALLLVLSATALTWTLMAGDSAGGKSQEPDKPAVKADDKPKEAVKSLSAKIVLKSKLPLEGRDLSAELVLTNDGDQPLRLCKLCGTKRRGNFDFSDTTFRPDEIAKPPFSAEESAKNIVTLKPGESVSLALELTRFRGTDGKYKIAAAYEVGEAFAKQHDTWVGRVEAKPVVIDVQDSKKGPPKDPREKPPALPASSIKLEAKGKLILKDNSYWVQAHDPTFTEVELLVQLERAEDKNRELDKHLKALEGQVVVVTGYMDLRRVDGQKKTIAIHLKEIDQVKMVGPEEKPK